MKLYGNVTNRLEEGNNYTGRELRVGDDITMYLWSDRNCYHITDVISQKEIKVKRYEVCADFSKPGGEGHQDWLYFKSINEMHKYLNSVIPNATYDENLKEAEPETWIYRYNKWMGKSSWNKERLQLAINLCKEDLKPGVNYRGLLRYRTGLNDKELDLIEEGKTIDKYYPLSGNISFGVRDYYYDWEF